MSPADAFPVGWTGTVVDQSWRDRLVESGPDPTGRIDVGDDEWDAFVAALRGQ